MMTGGTERLPGEVVEVYRPRDSREVVEVYTRSLPGKMARQAPVRTVRKRRKTGLWIFLACLITVTALAVAAWLLRGSMGEYRDHFERYDFDQEQESAQVEGVQIPTYPYGQGAELTVTQDHGREMTVQEIYQQVNPAVVTVMAELGDGVSVGTGVIFTTDGYILTNYHVVEGGSACLVELESGIQFEALYVAGDIKNDLAVLKVDATGLPAAQFGDSDTLQVGDPVYAIGNPLGVELRGTLTDGIVSAINRDVTVDGRVMTLIQTNAALNSGNSGGPLIDRYGRVVGINVIKMSSRYSNVEGLGFAIPSSSMDRMVNDLLTYGEVLPEPELGVTVLREGIPLKNGLVGLEVWSVNPGSAADRAGIREGDYILTAGGEPMYTSQALLRVRRYLYIGDTLSMELMRDGKRLEVTLELTDAVE